ncbi:hypothetical protein MP638_006662 [Amoeboaphelidium occidentale]|nr:hypothetical protein MP638_006662 [Amoeboaphelidium occidentale]
MRHIYHSLVLALTTFSVAHAQLTKNLQGCAETYDDMVDYFPEKTTPTSTTGFTVVYEKSYKIVKNVASNEELVLYQCGTPKPSRAGNKIKYFAVPLQGVAVTDTTTTSFLEILGLRGAIKGLGSAEYAVSACLQKMASDNLLMRLGYQETSNNTYLESNTNFQAVLDGYSSGEFSPVRVTVPASADDSPLKRAEWVKLISLFFNKEAAANTYYDGVVAEYTCVSTNAKSAAKPKVVAWINYFPAYPEFSQPAQWFIDTASYKAAFTQDAGGVAPKVSGSGVYTSASDFLSALKSIDADIVIDQSYMPDVTKDPYDQFKIAYGLKETSDDDIKKQYKFAKNDQIWRVDANRSPAGADGWFETAIAMPDAVIKDLAAIVAGGATSNDGFEWFRNASKKQTVIVTESSACSDVTASVTPAFAVEKCEVKLENGVTNAGESVQVPSMYTIALSAILAVFLG